MKDVIDYCCKEADSHEPNTVCSQCNLPVDGYGNTENDFLYCSFPDCGCDGARLCMARKPNNNATRCNVEGMYTRTDLVAKKAKIALVGLCLDMKKDQPNEQET